MNPKVDEFIEKSSKWATEFTALRAILLDCMLVEELKWGVPCYTFQNTNIIMLGGYKESCVISFLKGALLSDTERILIQQTEQSQSVRIVRFTNIKDIVAQTSVLKTYIFEAIEIEKAGLKVEMKMSTDLAFPDELLKIFDENTTFKTAFEALTPGRQRGYNLYFSDPKQSKTRTSRIENSIARILDGKGIHDCTCGLSKKMPTCDGSHKFLKQDVINR